LLLPNGGHPLSHRPPRRPAAPPQRRRGHTSVLCGFPPPGGGTAATPLPPICPFLLPGGKNKAISTDETKQRREELAATRVNWMSLLVDSRNREEGRHWFGSHGSGFGAWRLIKIRQSSTPVSCFLTKRSPCSFGLSANNQQYFSLRINQPSTTSQQYFSLRTNQHQRSATSQTTRLVTVFYGGVRELRWLLENRDHGIVLWSVLQPVAGDMPSD
jgi:hypothetical protein